jgi:hypothetical protein
MANELTPREEKLLETLRSSQRSREELLSLVEDARRNCRDDFEIGILEILDRRVPDFNESATAETESSRSTSATFAGKTRQFDSAKDAYGWLFESMLGTLGKVDDQLLDDFVFAKLVGTGRHGARYVARSLDRLFPNDPERASNPHMSHRLLNGWLLNLNLSNKQKNERLHALDAFLPRDQQREWSWTGFVEEGPTLEEIIAGISNADHA